MTDDAENLEQLQTLAALLKGQARDLADQLTRLEMAAENLGLHSNALAVMRVAEAEAYDLAGRLDSVLYRLGQVEAGHEVSAPPSSARARLRGLQAACGRHSPRHDRPDQCLYCGATLEAPAPEDSSPEGSSHG